MNLRFLYKIHSIIGLISAIILIMLAITGIALNHTEYLQMDSQMIKSKTILDWYDIKSPNKIQSFSSKNHYFSQVNQQIYLDKQFLLATPNNIKGAVETENFIIVALNDSLLLLSLQGELIEQSPLNTIEKIGLDKQQAIVIQSKTGITSSKDNLLSWQAYDNSPVSWSKNTPTPKAIGEAIKNSFRSSILPLERVILDIHSGRFFGFIGVLLVDISAIFLVILTISGCSIWLKRKFRFFQL
ncbi:MAG: PepSY domain-containing protein [Methylococcales bacterium]|nr:PepSY domain-containing protein [Methylococcales bacterium]